MRRLLRFKLRTALGFVFAIAVCLAWLVRDAAVQRRAVSHIQRAGGKVWFTWQRDSFDWLSPYPDQPPMWPKWLVDRLGVDFFGHPVMVRATVDKGSYQELESLQDLTRLEELRLCVSRGADDRFLRILRGLGNLRRLGLYESGVTDAELAYVARLQNLDELDLSYCPSITDAGWMRLESLRGLRVLVLDRTAITDAGLENVGKLTSLRELYITGTSISDRGLAHLTSLSRLESFGASECSAITDVGVAHLARLANLKSLSLSHTEITDRGLYYLSGLRRLAHLYVGNTGVTTGGVRELQDVLPELEIYPP